MKVEIKVSVDITLGDELADPKHGDPLQDRMQLAAREAVSNAMHFAADSGFSHEMEDIAFLEFIDAELLP